MKIAFISTMSAMAWGGSEVLWSQTAAEALRQGHTVFVSVAVWPHVPPAIATLQQLGATVQFRPHYSSQLATRLVRRVRYALWDRTLEKCLADFQPDVVCVSQGGNFDLADLANLRHYLLASRVPYCIVCHNYDANSLPPTRMRQAAAEAYAGAARVYFVSSEQARVSLRQLARSFDNVELVHNPVNIKEPRLLPWPTTLPVQFAVVGSLHIDFKGQDIILEVLSQKKWKARDWHLNIYGEGYDQSYIQELIALYGLAERVTLHGYCPDIQQIWLNSHLMLMPSRRDAAPLAVMEAMLSGRPVVATSIGTIAEWVQPGVNGFIAAAATTPLFDTALEQAWQVRTEWPEMGQRAFAWAIEQVQVNPAHSMLANLAALGQVVAIVA